MLNDTRGATLEAVISRMKTMGTPIRFVAISATIPNVGDIAEWLGHGTADEYSEQEMIAQACSSVTAVTKVFGEMYRPVKLEKFVYGYTKSERCSDFLFDASLDKQYGYCDVSSLMHY